MLLQSPFFHQAATIHIRPGIPLHSRLVSGADRFYQEAGVYRKQHLQKIVAQWIAPSLAIIVAFLLIFKFRIVTRFFRMKDIPRVGMILVAVWLIGTSLMYYAEHKVNDYYGTLPAAAWSTLMNWINFGI